MANGNRLQTTLARTSATTRQHSLATSVNFKTSADGHTSHRRLAAGVDALTKADGTVRLALKLHRLSRGANVCHRSPRDGDNRSSTVRRMQPLPTGKRINVGNNPHADTHDRCTQGTALVETMLPALQKHSGCDLLHTTWRL